MRKARATKLTEDTLRRIREGEAWPLGKVIVGLVDGSFVVTDCHGHTATGLAKEEAAQRIIENLMAV